jgi:hypothetical protein
MKIRKAAAAILSLTMALTMLAGCGDNDSSKSAATNSTSQNTSTTENSASDDGNSEAAPEGTLTEPDFLSSLTGGSGPDFYNMSYEDVNKQLGVILSMDNCQVFTNDNKGNITAKYYIGKTDSMLCGRVKLAKEHNVSVTFTFEDNKLKKMSVKAEGLDDAKEADAIAEDFLKALDGKLPEGYVQFTPVEHKKSREVGFTRNKEDFCVSVKRDESLDGSYYALFNLENYAERYNMK